MTTHRDFFLEEIYQKARDDSQIVLISVDMGAPSLDKFREELPNQFIAAGIAEQNSINIAAGMSQAGKKVFVYMMACWVARCFEQIRYSCAMTGYPITILGNGVGLGYAPAGPAHEPTEDLCYMRSIEGMEIYSPSSKSQVTHIADLTLRNPKLRYVRLERTIDNAILHRTHTDVSQSFDILYEHHGATKSHISIISSGFMLKRATQLGELLSRDGYGVKVIDLWKIKPIDPKDLVATLKESSLVITIEEQYKFGAFGSAILEAISDGEFLIPVKRFGLSNAFVFQNGSRDNLLNAEGLSVESLYEESKNAIVRLANQDSQ